LNATDDYYAKEAQRLLADDTFAEAMTRVRVTALNDLATVDADDKTAILRLQAYVAVTSDVLDELRSMILAIGKDGGGFDPNGTPA